MDKSKLLNFISKYSLNGLCNVVKWDSKNRGLITNFRTENKNTLGMVAVKGINFPDGQYGIYNTKGLIKIIGALQNEFEVEVGDRNECLVFKDETVKAQFILANLDIIENPPTTKNLPDSDFEFEINSIFMDKFLKAKSALEESSNIAFINEGDEIVLVINYAVHNTDRITIKTGIQHNLSSPLLFDAEILKEVFMANKDCTKGTMKVSEQGLMICQFTGEDIASKYFMVMLESNDGE